MTTKSTLRHFVSDELLFIVENLTSLRIQNFNFHINNNKKLENNESIRMRKNFNEF